MGLDIDTLINALDNDDNAKLMKLDYTSVKKMKNDMLQRLGLSREVLVKYHKSLKHYRYIDEIPDIKFGSYVRWISLTNPNNIKLTNGGVVCDVKIGNDVSVLCRNRNNLVFEFKMAKCLVFQKLSEEERVLLSAMEYLNK